MSNNVSSKNSLFLPMLALFVWVFLVFFGILKLQTHWWFEDDPINFAFARGFENPLSFFISRDALGAPSMGIQPIPMMNLFYWFDAHWLGLNPLYGYVHTFVVYLAATFTLFLLARKFITTPRALFVSVMWSISLPVVVLLEFLSTRHYLYGLFFSLLAILFSLQSDETAHKSRKNFLLLLALLSMLLAFFCKQIFVLFLCSYFVLRLATLKNRFELIFFSVSLLFYGLWVYIVHGTQAGYQPIFVRSFAESLFFLKHAFSSPFGPEFLSLIWTLALIAYALRLFILSSEFRASSWILRVGFIVLFGSAFAGIVPVSGALARAGHDPGTWYRATCLWTTVLLVGGLLAISKHATPIRFWAFSSCLFAFSYIQLSKTSAYWSAMKNQYQIEGQAALANPNVTRTSSLPAWWFWEGLENLYGVKLSVIKK